MATATDRVVGVSVLLREVASYELYKPMKRKSSKNQRVPVVSFPGKLLLGEIDRNYFMKLLHSPGDVGVYTATVVTFNAHYYELMHRLKQNQLLVLIEGTLFWLTSPPTATDGCYVEQATDSLEIMEAVEDIRKYQLPVERDIKIFFKRVYENKKIHKTPY